MDRSEADLHRINDVLESQEVSCRACASVYFRGQSLRAFLDPRFLQGKSDFLLAQVLSSQQYPHLCADPLLVRLQKGRVTLAYTWWPAFIRTRRCHLSLPLLCFHRGPVCLSCFTGTAILCLLVQRCKFIFKNLYTNNKRNKHFLKRISKVSTNSVATRASRTI